MLVEKIQIAAFTYFSSGMTLLQADMGAKFLVNSILIQGRADANQWVTRFKVRVSDDTLHWVNVLSDGTTTDAADGFVFQGNTDRNTVVQVTFENPILTRHVRLLPQAFVGHYSLRWEVLACEAPGG